MSKMLNEPIDISKEFWDENNDFFLPDKIVDFDDADMRGRLQWLFYRFQRDWFFNKMDKHLELQEKSPAPYQDYPLYPASDFSLSFITEKTIRLRIRTSDIVRKDDVSLIIDEDYVKQKVDWKKKTTGNTIHFMSSYGSLELNRDSFGLKLKDKNNKVLFSTLMLPKIEAMYSKAVPFSYLKRSKDQKKYMAASFSIMPGEKFYGCGESFTSLNKRGQKVVLFSYDTQSSATGNMYKPIPFFFSNRGYGMFLNTTTPATFDFGHTHAGTTTLLSGDDELDLFFFIGSPQEILGEYTRLTGRSPLPPLWSFGLWMGRFSYRSQKEVEEVAAKMREENFPCDVIHIDAGWFENGINCDFRFGKKAFPDPKKMFEKLHQLGFKVSLWQIPYFTPTNPVFKEVVEKGLYVKDGKGGLPTDDAILDFSNPEAVSWYREKIAALLEMGADAIKVDFGEAAPIHGVYGSGRTGWYEHNFYPLRYNKVVADLTKGKHDENIIWARSAWAGSQRYPVHWGGDAEVSDAGMAGTLRGGLSLGLSGFSFWSHDIGGFSGSPKEELFARWSFFGLMSSHSRVHGVPPREPWHFSKKFQDYFREITKLKYRLMPYIYTQAAICCKMGLPMVKALLLNYPDDPNVWDIEDEYLLGNDILIAPLMEEGEKERNVYLPAGRWISHDDKTICEGGQWHRIKSRNLPGLLFYRYGSVVPFAASVPSTSMIDWEKMTFVPFVEADGEIARGFYQNTEEADTNQIEITRKEGGWKVSDIRYKKIIDYKSLNGYD